jgi:uncharacterized protein (TIGR00730 family)
LKVVTIFGSSAPSAGSPVYEEARRLGFLLAREGFGISNGGYGGLMEATARGAQEGGGPTFGVTCRIWPTRANRWIQQETPTESYLDRLRVLAERGDAYIVLPGGTGTLAELAVVWEMMNKGTLARAIGGRKPLLAKKPYWEGVVDCLKQESRLSLQPIEQAMERYAPVLSFITLFSHPEEAVALLVEAFDGHGARE